MKISDEKMIELRVKAMELALKSTSSLTGVSNATKEAYEWILGKLTQQEPFTSTLDAEKLTAAEYFKPDANQQIIIRQIRKASKNDAWVYLKSKSFRNKELLLKEDMVEMLVEFANSINPVKE